MKTLTIFLTTTLHLCYMFASSTGAVIINEISERNSPEIKEIVDQGNRAFAQQFLDNAVPDILYEKTLLKDHALVESLKKNGVQYMSSLKVKEIDTLTDEEGISKTVVDSFINDIVGMNCIWDANILKCCQSKVASESTCLFAEFLNERIILSRHIGGKILWTKFFQAEDEDQGETTIREDKITATVTRKHCSLKGLEVECWIILKVKKSYKVSFKAKLELPALLKLSVSINGRVYWSHESGIRKNKADLCIKGKICFKITWTRLPKSGFKICFKVTKLFGMKIGIAPLCTRIGNNVDGIPTSTKDPNLPQDSNKQNNNLLLSNYPYENRVLGFE